jgi:hypothetical protein
MRCSDCQGRGFVQVPGEFILQPDLSRTRFVSVDKLRTCAACGGSGIAGIVSCCEDDMPAGAQGTVGWLGGEWDK